MRIEDNWKDVVIYYVGFYVEVKGYERKLIKKTLVLEQEIADHEVVKIILKNFQGVCEVAYVDMLDESALKII